jgi:hypothetical protein
MESRPEETCGPKVNMPETISAVSAKTNNLCRFPDAIKILYRHT